MKIKFKKGYIQIEAPRFVTFLGRISTGSPHAKAAAFFPLIFIRDEQFAPAWLINHERIHFKQQVETLFVGTFLITLIEGLYARIILKKSKEDRYTYSAAEQEAYLNMHNLEYLKIRRWGSLFYYIGHKKAFKLVGPGGLQFLE